MYIKSLELVGGCGCGRVGVLIVVVGVVSGSGYLLA